MQISRLFEIVYLLLEQKNATAKQLASRFGVSVRTIYRDVEALSAAGIPVYMCRGKGGGIRLLDNFVLNKSMLTEHEQNEILTALSAVQAVNQPATQPALSKMQAIFGKQNQDWIRVNFSPWHGFDLKFEIIKQAVLAKQVISFDYHGRGQERTCRTVEPLQLRYNVNAWYLYAFCRERQSVRTFKISRIQNVKLTQLSHDRVFTEQDEPPAAYDSSNFIKLVLKIDNSQSYRIFDEFSDNEVLENDDHSFTVSLYYPEDEWVYGYILSFGHYAQVLEPAHIRSIIRERLQKAGLKYQ